MSAAPAHRRDVSASHRSGQTGSVHAHYRGPGWLTRNVFNRAVAFLTRHGLSVLGSRVLAVKGRTSGAWRTTPVNLLEHDGHRYLVSARGEGRWVRSLRVAGPASRGSASAPRHFAVASCPTRRRCRAARLPEEVEGRGRVFFDGVGPDSTDAQIRAIAGKHPALEVLPVH